MVTKLVLKNYKQFINLEINFQKGLNVIIGKNEAGKSSIMSAISNALYQDATTKSQTFLNSIKAWKNPDIGAYIEIHLLTGGKYKIVRDFHNASNSLEGGDIRNDDYKSIQRILEQTVNLPSKNIFEITTFVKQAEITGIKLSDDLRNQLQSIAASSSSANEENFSITNGIKKLKQELKDIELGLNRPSKNPGLILSAKNAIQATETSLAELEKRWAKVSEATESGSDRHLHLEEVKKEIGELKITLENYSKGEDARKKLAELDKRLTELSVQINYIQNQKSSITQFNSETKVFDKFNEKGQEQVAKDADEIVKIRQTIKAHQENISELQEKYNSTSAGNKLNYMDLDKKSMRISIFINLGYLVAVIGLSIALAGQLIVNESVSIIGVFILAAGLILAGISNLFSIIQRTFKNITLKEGKSTSATTVIQTQIESTKNKILELKAKIDSIISNYELIEVNEFFSAKAKYITLLSEIERVKSAIEANLNGKKIEDLENEQVALLAEKKEIEVNVLTDEVKLASLDANDYLRKRRQLDILEIERRKLEEEVTASRVRTEENEVDYAELVDYREKIDLETKKLEFLEERRTLLTKTIELLERSMEKTATSAGNLVSEKVEKYLPLLTESRYKDIRLTKDFSVEVFSSEANDWILPLGQLSLGTVDQIYLLTRIALAQVILADKAKYIFLDDPFVTFDQERLENMKLILQDLADDYQIFLLTHNNYYYDWGNLIRI